MLPSTKLCFIKLCLVANSWVVSPGVILGADGNKSARTTLPSSLMSSSNPALTLPSLLGPSTGPFRTICLEFLLVLGGMLFELKRAKGWSLLKRRQGRPLHSTIGPWTTPGSELIGDNDLAGTECHQVAISLEQLHFDHVQVTDGHPLHVLGFDVKRP